MLNVSNNKYLKMKYNPVARKGSKNPENVVIYPKFFKETSVYGWLVFFRKLLLFHSPSTLPFWSQCQ